MKTGEDGEGTGSPAKVKTVGDGTYNMVSQHIRLCHFSCVYIAMQSLLQFRPTTRYAITTVETVRDDTYVVV